MNKIYKLKFSQKLRQLVAVSELATNAVAKTDSSKHVSETNESTRISPSLAARGLKLSLALASVAGLAATAQAHTGASVASGTATIDTQGLLTTITNSPNAIINWQSFNIGKNEIVKFVQQSASSTVLNRVLGNQVSQILGTLQSNGKVFLVNPNGIVFGKHASVDVNSLVASTLDIKNQDFLNGNYVFNKDKDQAIANILNQGMIKVNDNGTIALVGGSVVNTGVLEARNGTIFLLAGNTIEIADLNNPLVSYKVTAKNRAVNLGQIIGQKVTVLGNKVLNGQAPDNAQEFADLVGAYADNSNQASISASGEVLLFGGSEAEQLQSTAQTNAQVVGVRNAIVDNNGTIDVSNTAANGQAGSVKILGDTVVINNHSQILADATQGTAGNIAIGGDALGAGDVKLAKTTVFKADQKTSASGHYQGGNVVMWGDYGIADGEFAVTSEAGDGGLIETSAKQLVFGDNFQTKVSTQSDTAKAGTWVIDPDELFILNSADTNFEQHKTDHDLTGSNASFTGTDPYSFNESGANSYLLDQQLTDVLDQGGKVQLQSVGNTTYINATIGTQGRGTLINTMMPVYTHNDGVVEVTKADVPRVLTLENSTFNIQKWDFTNDPTQVEKDRPHREYSLHGSYQINNSTIQVRDDLTPYSTGSDTYFAVDNSTITVGGSFTNRVTLQDGSEVNTINVTTGSTTGFKYQFNNSTLTIDKDLYQTVDSSDPALATDNKHSIDLRVTTATAGFAGATGAASETPSGGISIFDSKLEDNVGKVNIVVAKSELNNATIISDSADSTVTGINLDFDAINPGPQIAQLSTQADQVTLKGNSVTITTGNGTNFTNSNVMATATDGTGVTVNADLLRGGTFSKAETVFVNSELSSKAGLNLNTYNVTFDNSTVSSTNDVEFGTAKDTRNNPFTNIVTIKGGSLTSEGSVNLSPVTKLSIEKSTGTQELPTITSAGDVTLATTKSSNTNVVTINDATIQAHDDISVQAPNALTITNTKFIASDIANTPALASDIQDGTVSIVAESADLTFTNSTAVAKNDVTLTSKKIDGAITITDGAGNLTSLEANVVIGTDNAASKLSSLIVNNTEINTQGALDLASSTTTTIGSSTINAKNTLNVRGTTLDIQESTLKTQAGDLSIGDRTTEMTTITNSHFSTELDTVPTGNNGVDIGVAGKNGVTITSSEFTTSRDLNFTSSSGKVQVITGGAVKVRRDVNITADTISLDGFNPTGLTDGSKVNNISLDATGTEGLTLENADISATNDVTLKSTGGPLSLTGGTVSSDTKDISLSGKTVALDGTVVTAPKNVAIESTEGSVELTNAQVTAEGGTATITGKTDVILNEGTKVVAQDAITVTATEGKVEATGTNLTSNTSKVDVTAKTDLKLDNSNITAQTSSALVAGGKLTAKDSNITAKENGVDIDATSGAELDNANISAKEAVTVDVTAGGLTTQNGGAIKSEDTIALTATGDSSLTGTNIEAQKAVSVTTTGTGTLELRGVNVTSVDETAMVSSAGDLTLGNSNITATKAVTVASTAGAVTAHKSNITSKENTVMVSAANDLNFDNSNITGSLATTVTSTGGKVSSTGGTVKSDTADVTLTGAGIELTDAKVEGATGAKIDGGETEATTLKNVAMNGGTGTAEITGGSVALNNGTKVEATQDITVESKAAAVKITGANLTVSGAANKATITAKTDVTVTNSNVTAPTGVSVAAEGKATIKASNVTATTTSPDGTVTATGPVSVVAGSVELNNANITGKETTLTSTAADGTLKVISSDVEATAGKANIKAAGDISLDSSKIESSEEVNVTSIAGAVSTEGTNLTAKAPNKVILDATTDLYVSNTNISAGNVDLKSGRDLTLANGTGLSTEKDLVVSSAGNVTIANAIVESTTGSATVKSTSGGNVTIKDKAKVVGKTDAILETTGNISLDNANITAQGGEAKVEAGNNVTATNSNVSGKTAVKLISTNENVTTTGTNITAPEATFKAGKDVTLSNTNISADAITLDPANDLTLKDQTNLVTKADITVTAPGNVTINNSKVESTEGNAIVEAGPGKDLTLTNNAKVAAKKEAKVTAEGNVTLENANVTGGTAATVTAGNDLSVTGSNITATKGKATLTANNNVSLKQANISGVDIDVISTTKDVNVVGSLVNASNQLKVEAAAGTVNLTGSNLTATDKVTLHALTELNLTENANVSGKNVDLNSTKVSVLSDSKIKAAENASINATEDVTVTGSKVVGDFAVNITTTGQAVITGSNLTAENGEAKVNATNGVTLSNANLSGQDVSLLSEQAIAVDNSKAKATTGDVTVATDKDITIENGSVLDAATNVNITSGGEAAVSGSKLIATAGEAKVSGATKATLDNADVTGASVTAIATGADGTVEVKGKSTTDATKGDTTVSAAKDVTVTDSTLNASENVNITSTDANTTVTGSNVTATNGEAKINAKENVTIGNSNVSGKDVTVTSEEGKVEANKLTANATDGNTSIIAPGNVAVTGSDLKATQDVNVTSTAGDTNFTGSNATATDGTVTISGAGNTTVDGSNLTGGVDVNVTGDGNVTVTNGTNSTAGRDVNIQSPNGTATVTASNQTAGRDVNINGKDGVDLTEANSTAGRELAFESDGVVNAKNSNGKAPQIHLNGGSGTYEDGGDNVWEGNIASTGVAAGDDNNGLENHFWNNDESQNDTSREIIGRDGGQTISYQVLGSDGNSVTIDAAHADTVVSSQEAQDSNSRLGSSANPGISTATTVNLAGCYNSVINLASSYNLAPADLANPAVLSSHPDLKAAMANMVDCYNNYMQQHGGGSGSNNCDQALVEKVAKLGGKNGVEALSHALTGCNTSKK